MSAISTLIEMSEVAGFPPTRRTLPGPYDCPTHQVPLVTEQVEVFNGWHQLHSCPKFDGTCGYDPAGPTEQIDPPEDVDADGTPST